jgi:DNA-binding NarL/FixJ family response regulator
VAGGGGSSPFQITLRASERRWLKSLTRRGAAEHRQVTRAKIVLLAAAGWTNRAIARKLGLTPNTVTKWRKRFYQEGAARHPRGAAWPLESRRTAHRGPGYRPGR